MSGNSVLTPYFPTWARQYKGDPGFAITVSGGFMLDLFLLLCEDASNIPANKRDALRSLHNTCWCNVWLVYFYIQNIRLPNDIATTIVDLVISKRSKTTSAWWCAQRAIIGSLRLTLNLWEAVDGAATNIVPHVPDAPTITMALHAGHYTVFFPRNAPKLLAQVHARVAASSGILWVRDPENPNNPELARDARNAQLAFDTGATRVTPVTLPTQFDLHLAEALADSERSFKREQELASELLAAELESIEIHDYERRVADHQLAGRLAGSVSQVPIWH
jgi:hypothetical protein